MSEIIDHYTNIQTKYDTDASGILADLCRKKDKENADLRARLSAIESQVGVLREALHYDKTGLAGALASVIAEVKGRRWILDGRGPYTHDDEGYQREAGFAFNAIEDIAVRALNTSGQLVIGAELALSTPPPARWKAMQRVIKVATHIRNTGGSISAAVMQELEDSVEALAALEVTTDDQ